MQTGAALSTCSQLRGSTSLTLQETTVSSRSNFLGRKSFCPQAVANVDTDASECGGGACLYCASVAVLHAAWPLLHEEVSKVSKQHVNPGGCSRNAVLLLLFSCPTAPSVGQSPTQQRSPTSNPVNTDPETWIFLNEPVDASQSRYKIHGLIFEISSSGVLAQRHKIIKPCTSYYSPIIKSIALM